MYFPYQYQFEMMEDPLFHHGLEPHFGVALVPNDFTSDRIIPRSGSHHLPTGYRRPWAIAREAVRAMTKDKKNPGIHFGTHGFQTCVDVHHFEPSEITVKTVDQTVVIEGKHVERDDGYGSVSRHFIRKYVLPKEYDMNTVHTSLSSDGILTIKAPPPVSSAGERHVPITHSAMPVHMSVKDNKPNSAGN